MFFAHLPEAHPPTSLDLQDTITEIQTEEEEWKKEKIATDRLSYQDEIKCDSTGDVTMEIEEGGSLSSSSHHVTYSELIRNMNTPSTMDSFKTRLKLT